MRRIAPPAGEASPGGAPSCSRNAAWSRRCSRARDGVRTASCGCRNQPVERAPERISVEALATSPTIVWSATVNTGPMLHFHPGKLIVLVLIADEVQLAGLDLVRHAPMLERFLAPVGDPHFGRLELADGHGQLVPIG